MGAQLVSRAFAFGAQVKLKPNEMRLLLWMSLRALDQDNPPRYFASREESAVGLGRMVPEAVPVDDPTFQKVEADRLSAFQLVKVATQGLVGLGAIERIQEGRTGRRAEYALRFDLDEEGSATDATGKKSLPLTGKKSLPPGVTNSYQEGKGILTPNKKKTNNEEQLSGEISPPSTTYSSGVDKSDASAA